MGQVVWVDSRSRISGSDSRFEIGLRESLHIREETRVRVDKCTFVDSFLTTDCGKYLYFASPAGFSYVSVPEGAYTGPALASAIQLATGRTTTFSLLTNSIVHTLASATQQWLSDADLASRTGAFPPSASSTNPLSLNQILGDGQNVGTTVTWSFVRMSPYTVLYLRSNMLRCSDHHGPMGTHNILCSIPLTRGVGSSVEASSPDNVYYSLAGKSSIRTFDIELTDYMGRAVNLRGRQATCVAAHVRLTTLKNHNT